MKNKFYLSASRSRYREIRMVHDDLQEVGFDITSSWLEDDPQYPAIDDSDDDSLPDRDRDRLDLVESDFCVFFTDGTAEEGENNLVYIELGIAIALRKKCIVIGPEEDVIYHFNLARYDSWEDFKKKTSEGFRTKSMNPGEDIVFRVPFYPTNNN